MAFPQLTREQMLDRCDLAGVARVVSVGRESPDSPNVAKLAFVNVRKGEPQARDGVVFVRLHGSAYDSGEIGLTAWSDWWDYPVGSVVETHLDWNGPEDVYQTTWPGAVREVDPQMAQVA